MKKIFIHVLLLVASTNVFAQQDILKNVNSFYMKPEGYLNNLNSVIVLDNTIKRKFYGPDYNSVIDELYPNSAFFKMRYPSDQGEEGLIHISWSPRTESLASSTIESLTTNLFNALTVDDDADTRTIRYIKNDVTHAGYMYNSRYNTIYFEILSLAKREKVGGYVSINLVSSELKDKFMDIFIRNLKFGPYTPSRVNPETPPRTIPR